MILEGLGYRQKENPELEQTVSAVFDTAPAADVKRGKWKRGAFTDVAPKDVWFFYCSECGNRVHQWRTRYCPSCGSFNMDKKDVACVDARKTDGE